MCYVCIPLEWYLRNVCVPAFWSSFHKYTCTMFTFTIWISFIFLTVFYLFLLTLPLFHPVWNSFRLANRKRWTYTSILHSRNEKYMSCRRRNKLITFPLVLFVRVRLSSHPTPSFYPILWYRYMHIQAHIRRLSIDSMGMIMLALFVGERKAAEKV